LSFRYSNGNNYVEGDFSQLEKLTRELDKNHFVDVGILGKGGKMHPGSEINLAQLGAVHEFGRLDGSIPERSFIMMPIETHQKEIEAEARKNMQSRLEKQNVKGIFTDIGIAAEAVIQDAFDTGGFGTWPDIQEATKKRKGSEAILIDTGELRRSIASKAGTI
jgi:phage gpG-like protein